MLKRTLAAAAIGLFAMQPAIAETPAEFFKGKTIKLLVGYNPGGGYDVYARILANHYARHIPGSPNIVVQNMPGAGSLKATNYLYNVAPKDGTAIATMSRNIPLLGILGAKNVQFDPLKMNWLGSSTSGEADSYILWYRADQGITSIKDIIGPKGKEVVLGSTAPGSTGTDVPRVLADTIGLRHKMILGYRGSDDLFLAIARGEIKGRTVGLSAVKSSQAAWLDRKTMIPLVQFARVTRHPEFPNVPTARELAKDAKALQLIKFNEASFQFGRPFAAPPDMPADRLKALRTAFMAAHADPAYLEEAKKLNISVDPLDGEKVTEVIKEIAASDTDLIEYMRNLFAEAAKAKKKK
ncbi:MAG: hypothetical protein RLZ98_1481 [Pseudomonadota bacterium]|jgi:tripartite-type tricarboxylate transporter receptor subunit TctC